MGRKMPPQERCHGCKVALWKSGQSARNCARVPQNYLKPHSRCPEPFLLWGFDFPRTFWDQFPVYFWTWHFESPRPLGLYVLWPAVSGCLPAVPSTPIEPINPRQRQGLIHPGPNTASKACLTFLSQECAGKKPSTTVSGTSLGRESSCVRDTLCEAGLLEEGCWGGPPAGETDQVDTHN